MTTPTPIPPSSPSAEESKERGNKLFSGGNYLEALEAYEDAILKSPAMAVYYMNASACCAKLNEFGKAALFAGEAIRREPILTKAYYRRAVALIGLKEWKAALDDLRRVVKGMEEVSADVSSRVQQCEKELQKIAFAKAIHVDVFELDMKHIRQLEVPDSYQGPRVADEEPITFEFVKELMAWQKEEKKLHPHYAYRILHEANLLFKASPTVVDVQVPSGVFTVCGDIHGQYFDMVHIFDINGLPSIEHSYLFNGDLVDRGPYSVEVLLLAFAMKVVFPDNFFIARGNHESESINRMHGFYEEVARKYDDNRFFSIANSVLNALPLVHIINEHTFVVHGGLPSTGGSIRIDDLRKIDRFRVPEGGSTMSQLLWSDPQDQDGLSPSHRGEGILFGPDVTRDFLENNNLKRIIRSHVWEPTGYREQHDGKCITIFSAPNYTGTISKGAIINITPDNDIQYVSYDAAPFQGKAPKPRMQSQFNGLFN